MAAATRLPTLCAAPSTCTLLSSPRFTQTNSIPATATARRNPARPVKAITRPQEAAAVRGGGTELSAWTSVRQERWEGELPVQGHLPDWLSGTYLRNGPGQWDVGGGGASFRHLFDGYYRGR